MNSSQESQESQEQNSLLKDQFNSLKQKNVDRIVDKLVGGDDTLSAILSTTLLNTQMNNNVVSTIVNLYNQNKEYEEAILSEMEMTLDSNGDLIRC